jgi:hypothetical protein
MDEDEDDMKQEEKEEEKETPPVKEMSDKEKAIKRKIEGDQLFKDLFGNRPFKLCHKNTAAGENSITKYATSEFNQNISSDGQQAKIHYVTREKVKPEDVLPADLKSEKEPLSKLSPANLDPNDGFVDEIVVDQEKMMSFVRLGKSIVSMDPGRVNIYTGVRFNLSPDLLPQALQEQQKGQEQEQAQAQKVNQEKDEMIEMEVCDEDHLSLDSSCQPPLPPMIRPSKHQRKKLARNKRQAEAHQSVFTLTNRQYHHGCGHHDQSNILLNWRKESGIVRTVDRYLAENSETCNKTTFNLDVYSEYIKHIATHWRLLWDEVKKPKYRKLRFTIFQREQRYIHELAVEICLGNFDNTIVLWGGGKFKSSGKGHASAPNIGLLNKLRLYLEIYVVSEWGTSKNTACCFLPSIHCDQVQVQDQDDDVVNDVNSPPVAAPDKIKPRGLFYCKSRKKPPDKSFSLTASSSCSSSLAPTTERPHLCHSHSHFGSHNHFHGHVDSLNAVNTKNTTRENVKDNDVFLYSRPWNRDVSAAILIFYVTWFRAFRSFLGLPHCFDPCFRSNELM